MSYRDSHVTTQRNRKHVFPVPGCCTYEACTSDRPGHSINTIQGRLAAATPSKWIDAIVLSASIDGLVVVAELTGHIRSFWHHAPLTDWLPAGEPVAIHAIYFVLAHGEDRFSVAIA